MQLRFGFPYICALQTGAIVTTTGVSFYRLDLSIIAMQLYFLAFLQIYLVKFGEKFQFIRQIVDISPSPCYPLLQIKPLYLAKAFIRFYLPPRSHTEPFCRLSLTTKSFGPCEADFYFPKDLQLLDNLGLQFFMLHLDNCISRPDWILRHDPAQMRASLITPLQNRGRNLIRGERRTHKQETSRFKFALPAFKTEFVLLFGFSKLTEKAESKYRPVATISQIEIAPHALVVLVGECLPQTLLTFRAPRDLRLRRYT